MLAWTPVSDEAHPAAVLLLQENSYNSGNTIDNMACSRTVLLSAAVVLLLLTAVLGQKVTIRILFSCQVVRGSVPDVMPGIHRHAPHKGIAALLSAETPTQTVVKYHKNVFTFKGLAQGANTNTKDCQHSMHLKCYSAFTYVAA